MSEKRLTNGPSGILGSEEASFISEIFRSLGDPTRLRLVSVLSEDERCVHEICVALGLEQSAVSHQLRVLRDRRIVKARREGRHIYYSLEDEHIDELVNQCRRHWAHLEDEQ